MNAKEMTMPRWLRCIGVMSLALLTLGNGGCEQSPDPTDVQWSTAQKVDLSRTSGTITDKRIAYLVNAVHGGTVGDPYYCVTITEGLATGRGQSTEYCGVNRETYDAVVGGTALPIERIYTVYDLSKLDGRIVDRWANPPAGAWYVVVDRLTAIETYRVDAVTYYRHIDLGMRLPFEPQ
jgi:hypothetical protein